MLMKDSNNKGKHNTMLSLTLKNTSEINEKIKEIDIKSIIEELKELDQACQELKQALGQFNDNIK
jgi:hypothetical protein